jgi:sulfatase modifying factor 1
MRPRYPALLVVVIAGGCLVPRYEVEPLATTTGGQANAAGAANAGSSGMTAAAGAMGGDCGPDQKICDDQCVDIDDVNYGCTATSCNMSGCPAAGSATLACEAGMCVIGGCSTGTKKCDGKCVAISDPTYGCGDTSCDASDCPDPGAGTLVCEGGACSVGTCGVDTKQCGNKCVPLDENNGCSDPSDCTACASYESCLGTPTSCTCRADDVEACKGQACGTAVNNCQETIDCPNTCVAPAALCSDNACIECSVPADCPGPGSNVCARATCTNQKCGYTTAPSGTTCPGGSCSTTLPGICVRPAVNAGTASIDATEVTAGQYYQFVKAKGDDTSGEPSYCSWNTSFSPGSTEFEPNMADYDYPMVRVNWCSAYAYCQWAGRRLCGGIGGGAVAANGDRGDPTKSQWMRGCAGPSSLAYPYGDNFVDGRCNGPRAQAAAAPVASFPQCVGAYPGLYDMSGNVYEWLDSCDADGYCSHQGGSWLGLQGVPAETSMICESVASGVRSTETDWIGFRCCGP